MGFFDRFKKKKDDRTEANKEKESSEPQTGKRVKKYTSEGKPIYE